MEKLRALEVELERKHGCRVLIIQVATNVVIVIVLLNTITLTIINRMVIKCVQVDFTDVSVLPVIVQRLKEEKIEVRKSLSPILFSASSLSPLPQPLLSSSRI